MSRPNPNFTEQEIKTLFQAFVAQPAGDNSLSPRLQQLTTSEQMMDDGVVGTKASIFALISIAKDENFSVHDKRSFINALIAVPRVDEFLSVYHSLVFDEGRTLLHYAALCDSEEMATVLINKGADVRARDNEGNSPLHYAVELGGSSTYDLLAAGARLSQTNNAGETPIDLAVGGNGSDASSDGSVYEAEDKHLLEVIESNFAAHPIKSVATQVGDDLWARGDSIFHYAVKIGALDILQAGRECEKIDFYEVNNDKDTLLHYAAKYANNGNHEIAEFLLNEMSDPASALSTRNRHGQTPIDVCADPEVKSFLLSKLQVQVPETAPAKVYSNRAGTLESRTM